MTKLKELLSESLLQSLNVVPGQVVSNPYHTAFAPIEEQEEGEVNVGGYQTQHFDICPGATALYKDIESKGVDMELASRTAKLQDVLFFIEKHVEEEGYEPNPYYGEVAQILGDQIMTMSGMMDLGSEHSYIQGHIDRIQSAVQKDSVNEAKNIKVIFRSVAAKNKWMRNQKLSPTDKVVVSQSDTSLVLTPDMKDYVSKTNHRDLIYQVDMVNEGFKKEYEGNDGIIWKFNGTRRGIRGPIANFEPYYKGHNISKGGFNFSDEKQLLAFIKNYIVSTQIYNKYRFESVK